MNTYPRETVEFQPVAVAVNGVPVTSGVEFTTAAAGTRPTGWAAPVTLDAQIGVMVEGLAPGTWHVWARITSDPEVPVIDCGAFDVT